MRVLLYIITALVGVGLAGHYYPKNNPIQVTAFVAAPLLLWTLGWLAERARRTLVEHMLSGQMKNRLPVSMTRKHLGNAEDITWFMIASGYAGFTPGPTDENTDNDRHHGHHGDDMHHDDGTIDSYDD